MPRAVDQAAVLADVRLGQSVRAALSQPRLPWIICLRCAVVSNVLPVAMSFITLNMSLITLNMSLVLSAQPPPPHDSVQSPQSKVILFGERSLRRALSEYVEHFHGERNHQGEG
jgi:hypothetical protein